MTRLREVRLIGAGAGEAGRPGPVEGREGRLPGLNALAEVLRDVDPDGDDGWGLEPFGRAGVDETGCVKLQESSTQQNNMLATSVSTRTDLTTGLRHDRAQSPVVQKDYLRWLQCWARRPLSQIRHCSCSDVDSSPAGRSRPAWAKHFDTPDAFHMHHGFGSTSRGSSPDRHKGCHLPPNFLFCNSRQQLVGP